MKALTAIRFIAHIMAIRKEIALVVRRNAISLVEHVLAAVELTCFTFWRRTGLEFILALLAVGVKITDHQGWYALTFGTFKHSTGTWHL